MVLNLQKENVIFDFFSFNLFLGLVVIYYTTEVFANKFQDKKYKFIGGLFGALLGGYVMQQLMGTLKY